MRAAVDAMLTNSLDSSFSASFQFRSSLEGGNDGLDFSDNLDLDEHSITSMKIDRDMFDDIFLDEGPDNHHDDNFRDSFVATFKVPAERPSAVSSSLYPPSQHYVSDDAADKANAEAEAHDFMGSTSHSGPSSMTSGAPSIAPRRPRRRKTTDSVPVNMQDLQRPQESRRPYCRRKSMNSVPELHGEGPACGLDEFGDQDDHQMSWCHSKRRKSESILIDMDLQVPSRRNTEFDLPDFGNDPLASYISVAVHEAQDKIFRLRELLGHDQQGLINDIIIGGNNHPHANHQMTHQPVQSSNSLTRRASEHELPWTTPVHEAQDKIFRLRELLGHDQQGLINDIIIGGNNHPHANHQMTHQPVQSSNSLTRRASEHELPWTTPFPPHNIQQIQQDSLQQVTSMAKLQSAMERTSSTMKLLQDWDRAHGLPASHCPTMVNSSRSRKQLKEGVVLKKKWNGPPLLNNVTRRL